MITFAIRIRSEIFERIYIYIYIKKIIASGFKFLYKIHIQNYVTIEHKGV